MLSRFARRLFLATAVSLAFVAPAAGQFSVLPASSGQGGVVIIIITPSGGMTPSTFAVPTIPPFGGISLATPGAPPPSSTTFGGIPSGGAERSSAVNQTGPARSDDLARRIDALEKRLVATEESLAKTTRALTELVHVLEQMRRPPEPKRFEEEKKK
jgi:hypothetical protein